MDLKERYQQILDQIQAQPECNRERAQTRFLVIKDYQDVFLQEERERLGANFRSAAAVETYCRLKGVAVRSFYRWLGAYNKHGIKALLPHYGKTLYKRRDRVITASIKIHTEKPLLCLGQIKKIIEKCPAISPDVKSASLNLINANLEAIKRKENLRLDAPLSDEEVRQLQAYRAKNHKKHSAKATAILMANENSSMLDVMSATGRPIRTIYTWLRKFRDKRLDFIETKVSSPSREAVNESRKTRVIDILHKHPSLYDINLATWTFKAITQAYKAEYGDEISTGILQRVIKTTGYSWRHARKVLTSPDPEYKAKVEKVLDTLQSLKENEAFFFVDEVGPYKVKKYGGRYLGPAEEIVTIPEYQKSRGKVQFTAALEAVSNQLTWLFTENKCSESLIALLKVLTETYGHCRKLYFTWDAMTVHSSKALLSWMDEHNRRGEGPTIEIVPLPANSQFLNVIEAVFGGMKRAVICNSDYASAKEMKEAISRHFKERNQYYKDNPKRAGNKMWDRQRFDIQKLAGGLFKKM